MTLCPPRQHATPTQALTHLGLRAREAAVCMNVQRVQNGAGQDNAGVEWVMWDLTHTSDCCGLAVERWPATREHLRAKWAHKKAEWDGLSRAGAPATRTGHVTCRTHAMCVCTCVPASLCRRVACVSEEVGWVGAVHLHLQQQARPQGSVPRCRLPSTHQHWAACAHQHCMVTSDTARGWRGGAP